MKTWGFLMQRIDHRIAVSEQARLSAERWTPGDYEVIPNGVLIPDEADPGGAGAHESSSPAGRSRARGCRCCCARGPRSVRERVRR